MPVKAADPAAVSLDAAFAAAMDGPAKPREAPAPPEVDHSAPHGRDAGGNPVVKYGHNKDGSIRRSPAGRKPKDEQARTTAAQPAVELTARPGLPPRDFSAALMDAGETLWFGGSVVARVGPQIPLVGRFVPGRKLSATMAVLDAERPRLAAALNLAAQHDARARKLAVKLADGEVQWALTCLFMLAPFTGAVAAVWQGDTALSERQLPSLDELGTRNEAALDAALSRITMQMETAQAQQAAAVQGEMEAAMAAQNGQAGNG
ncbi:MAG TPA: hypothetical protein VMV92_00635 [Streptosporangiaceae bacterium]|nr:hypothetical protein [Streptosporangiaceae bacterium]